MGLPSFLGLRCHTENNGHCGSGLAPRMKPRGAWHRLRRCSRGKPAPTGLLLNQSVNFSSMGLPSFLGLRCHTENNGHCGSGLAPRMRPRGAWHRLRRCSQGKPAPTGLLLNQSVNFSSMGLPSFLGLRCHTENNGHCGSGLAPRMRPRGAWHRLRRCSRGKPAPTGLLLNQSVNFSSMGLPRLLGLRCHAENRGHCGSGLAPRMRPRGAWHRLRRCSRGKLPQVRLIFCKLR